jgi:glycogen synthase
MAKEKISLKAEADYLFESSWEVCNKVGGIYTVVSSKAALLNDIYQKNYFLIGPYFEKKRNFEYQEEKVPDFLKSAFLKLKNEGITCYFGKWIIEGEPYVILVDFSSLVQKKNDIKKELWDVYKIDSLYSQWDFEEPMVWSYAVGKLLEEISKNLKDKKIVGQFHEWLAGFSLLYLKNKKSTIKTIFTTHATMLGRSIAGSGESLYEMLPALNPDKEAYEHKIQDKYLTEKACASNCDVFTTVSEITAIEAEKILGRKADVILMNGLHMAQFPSFEEISLLHRQSRDKIREFFSYFFFPHYSFDLDESLTFFIVGRYEYKNKGIDIFMRALSLLNERLMKENSKKTIIVFFWIPREVHGTKLELSQNKMAFNHITEFIHKKTDDMQIKVINNIVSCDSENNICEKNVLSSVFDNEFLLELKKLKANFSRAGSPLLVTHNIPGEENDPLINEFIKFGLDNKKEDRVKIINYPVYLTGVDGLLDLEYYKAIVGCHLGVFPSYYEPWGYTPLESAAHGVPAITTDLAGFGRFMKDKTKNKGIYVLERMGKKDDAVIKKFADVLYNYTKFDRNERVKQKIAAKELSNLADWKSLIDNYIKAHNLALSR